MAITETQTGAEEVEYAGVWPAITSSAPKLAVVISCFNYDTFVGRAISSVLAQRNADCELVVVDDGSTDASWAIIKQSGAPACRLKNGGQRAACLFGFYKTRAPFVLFLDADDELKPGALGKILAALDGDVAKLQFPLTRIDAAGAVIGERHPALTAYRSRDRLMRQVLRTGVYRTPPTSGNVFRRDLCELLRDVDYDKAIDGVILFAAPFFGDVVSMSEPLANYRVHERNDSGLGREPEPALFERDIERFLARMNHLREIVRARAPAAVFPDPTTLFHFRELNFCLTVAARRQPKLAALLGLLRTLASEYMPLERKLGLASFFLLASVVSSEKAKALLAYRYSPGDRSTRGFLREVFNPPRAAPA